MMELRLYARILLRYWWLIAIPTVIAAAFAVPEMLTSAADGGFTTTIHYSAAQRPEAQPPRDGDFQDIWLASEYTVNAMTTWALTESFRREIAERVTADVPLEIHRLGVAADNQRSVGVLYLSYPDAEGLEAIAQAAIEVLQTRNRAYFPQVGAAPAEVTILGNPVIVAAPPPLTNRFAPVIRIGLGLIVGLGLALLAHYLDPTLRQREELEMIGLPVIGTLPRE